MARMHVVATTINFPKFLQTYRENLQKFGHIDDVKMWVVGDRKTPRESAAFAAEQKQQGLDVDYLDPESQERWLKRFPELDAIIPWNTDNRRNVGFLRALEEGCEILVSIDDDNYPLAHSDFYAGHVDTGRKVEREVFTSDNGWFNLCSELVIEPAVDVVPRGYLYRKRFAKQTSLGKQQVTLAAHAGLWLGDPDVDAATRLAFPIRAVGTKKRNIALQPGVWSPVNTQNTSIARRAIPAYYYIRMLEQLPGAKLDRYGDIWSGYFLTRCAEHLGESIGIGQPEVDHVRNVHDLLADLRAEFWGMVLTPHFIDTLRAGTLEGNDYVSAARSLASLLERSAGDIEQRANVTGVADYIRRISHHLRVWVDVCVELGAG
jgi:hypothetical protein